MREHDRDARNANVHRWNEGWQNRRWNERRDEGWWTTGYNSLHDGWGGRRPWPYGELDGDFYLRPYDRGPEWDRGFREGREAFFGEPGWWHPRMGRGWHPRGRFEAAYDPRLHGEASPWWRRDDWRFGWGGRRERSLWDQTKREVRDTWDRLRGSFSSLGPRGWSGGGGWGWGGWGGSGGSGSWGGGYLRSDERIREDVYDRLSWHPEIDPSLVDVIVREGELTLAGSVDDGRAKRIAEGIAEETPGVRRIWNRLRVVGRRLPIGIA